MTLRAFFHSYRMFDYEHVLAEREFTALTGTRPVLLRADDQLFGLESTSALAVSNALEILRERSTYFASVQSSGSDEYPTEQAVVEGSHWSLRETRGTGCRQATRYGPHGLHEYRGKFNPQMARALVNCVDPAAQTLLDPFCGSGTTLIEGMRLGLDVVGIDKSPMAGFIANVKTRAGSGKSDPTCLRDAVGSKYSSVRRAMGAARYSTTYDRPAWLSKHGHAYLASWFPQSSLAAVCAGLSLLDRPGLNLADDLLALAISSILRNCSLQLPDDLRVRRRPPGVVPTSVTEAADEAYAKIFLALDELAIAKTTPGRAEVFLGSADELADAEFSSRGRRLIVTSPPYATALPYIDTDRLSLVALGLASAQQLRGLEAELIGSREWNTSEARYWECARIENSQDLPQSVLELLSSVASRNAATGAGFRRAAVPALLYRYFSKMAKCFEAWSKYLRPGEHAVLVIGRNSTGKGPDRIDIHTPELLGDVAIGCDFTTAELIPFDTWPRYGLHSANGVKGEAALVVTRT